MAIRRFKTRAKQRFINWLLADDGTYLPETHIGPNSLKVGDRDITDEDNSTTIYDGSAQAIGDGNQSAHVNNAQINNVGVSAVPSSSKLASDSATTQIPLDATADNSVDDQNELDSTNDQIQVADDGTYLVSAKVLWDSDANWSTGDVIQMRPYVNGSRRSVERWTKNSTTNQTTLTPAYKMDLTAGDKIDLRVWQNSGATQTITTSTDGQGTVLTVVSLG